MLLLALWLAVGDAHVETARAPPADHLGDEMLARMTRVATQLVLHVGPREPDSETLRPTVDELYAIERTAALQPGFERAAYEVAWPALFATGAAVGGALRYTTERRQQPDVVDALGPACFSATVNLAVAAIMQ